VPGLVLRVLRTAALLARPESSPCPLGRAAGHGNALAGRVAGGSAQSGGRRIVSPPPARQLWASTLRGPEVSPVAQALSPDGTRLFVTGYVGPAVKSLTVAYSTATGARLWATTYPPDNAGGPGNVIAVSPDGTRVYVTAWVDGATIAYAAATGKQLWVTRSNLKRGHLNGLAVNPDGTTIYMAGTTSSTRRDAHIVVIAYDAATGRQRWLRYYTSVNRAGALAVAVSPDGSTVYVDGVTGAEFPSSYSLVVLAYQAATGTLKWATRYANRYTGGAEAVGAFGGPIVLSPGGRDLYVAGNVSSKYGHRVAATFAFRAATGTCLWLNPDTARGGGGEIAVAPGGRTVIFVGDRTGDIAGGYAISSYNASTGATRWARRAPVPGNAPPVSTGLVIDPHGDTAFVASSNGGGYFMAAWSVARGNVLWTTREAAAKVYYPVGIALSSDGTRLFVTGTAALPGGGMITVAYQT
jgi:PQQ-like domain